MRRVSLLFTLCIGAGTTCVDAPAAPAEAATLTSEDRPYLVLDLGTGNLSLRHGGAVLGDYDVRGIQLGAPRFLELIGHSGPGYPAGVWEPLRVVPEREREHIELRSDRPVEPDPVASVPWIPLPPEALNPTPGRFVIQYRGGLGLEVVRDGSSSADPHRSWRRWLASAGLLMPWHRDHVRLRLLMSEPEAGALYRSGAAEAALIVVPAE